MPADISDETRGVCFVVMGFGKKTDFESGRTLDLDKTYRNIIAPAVKAVKAQKQIVVKVGNVGGLSFAFNGKKIPSQGATGEVRILTFDPSGLQVTVPKAPS